MAYKADPGGNFASDAHRRVAAAVPNPDDECIDTDGVVGRIDLDEYADFSGEEVIEILEDLEADGDATKTKAGWRLTKAGFDVLTGPISTDGGREHA